MMMSVSKFRWGSVISADTDVGYELEAIATDFQRFDSSVQLYETYSKANLGYSNDKFCSPRIYNRIIIKKNRVI